MRLRFVVPPDVDAPTGGNVYDLAAAEALGHAGHEVELTRAGHGELAALLATPWPGPTLVDGLLACRQPAAITDAAGPVSTLVHMPLAWDGGLEPTEAVALAAVEGAALRASAVVIATSQWSADYLRTHHRLTGVAIARPGVAPASPVGGSDPPLFVQVAALLPHKDQVGVVHALARLADLPWRARLVGDLDRDPAYADTVRDAIHAGGLGDRVELAGRLTRDAAWSGANLALLPSLAESYGLVVTEALARGIPAVVSEGGPAEALGHTPGGEVPGVVVPAGQVDALADALRGWLTDHAFRSALRVRAQASRSTLAGWDETARQLHAALSTS